MLYREAKTEARQLFDKVAVGEVREEFCKQLKEKMLSRYEFYSAENDKESEQECQRFL